MHLPEAEVLNVHWTREIEAEWTRNVIAKQNADRQDIEDCLEGMRATAEGWEVAGYAQHIDGSRWRTQKIAMSPPLPASSSSKIGQVSRSPSLRGTSRAFLSAPSRTPCMRKRRTSWRTCRRLP